VHISARVFFAYSSGKCCVVIPSWYSQRRQFGIISDPTNPRALLAAERYVQNALRVHTDPKAPESKNGDDAFYEELYRQLSFKAVGGSHKMHLHKEPDYNSISDPALWLAYLLYLSRVLD
jgi:hypothetical protein